MIKIGRNKINQELKKTQISRTIKFDTLEESKEYLNLIKEARKKSGLKNGILVIEILKKYLNN